MNIPSLLILLSCFLAMGCTERLGASGLSDEEEKILSELPKVPVGLNSGYAIERRPSEKVDCKLSYRVSAPSLVADEWIFYAAHAPSLPSQEVSYVKSNPHGQLAFSFSVLQRKLLLIRVPGEGGAQHAVDLRVFTGAQLFSRKLIQGKSQEEAPTLSEPEKRVALRPTEMFDYPAPPFVVWLKERGYVRAKAEGEIDFARRVFQSLAGSFSYEYSEQMERQATRVCRLGKSDCGGLSVLFVAIMRSQGIPARCLSGRWTQSVEPGESLHGIAYYQSHVKAEFFAQGVGWVPVDLSLAVSYDRSSERLKFFGDDPGDFLTLHVDPTLSLDTHHFGVQKIDWLQGAAFWVKGGGKLEGLKTKENWEVR
ncbi:transglutaminase-like domain-containing protein [Roseibacillus persicicus]|uniref:transglutaminase-like domain-containing protein n=1 Tax=Roseibacillus persicicus TaxID=454148 RepID=UPI00398AFF31